MTDELPDRPLPPPTWRDLLDRFVPPERASALRAGAVVVALLAIAGIAWWALRPPPAPPPELSLPMAGTVEASSTTSTTVAAELVVHAAGAVASPGVHRVGAGARVADLLAAAGGPAPDTDLDRVNLAAPLADGQRVWFPRIGEPVPPGEVVAGGSPAAPGGPVNLNTASEAELETLPGVGPAIAAAIVEHREREGRFAVVDDLLDVPGIGPARLEDLRPHVTV